MRSSLSDRTPSCGRTWDKTNRSQSRSQSPPDQPPPRGSTIVGQAARLPCQSSASATPRTPSGKTTTLPPPRGSSPDTTTTNSRSTVRPGTPCRSPSAPHRAAMASISSIHSSLCRQPKMSFRPCRGLPRLTWLLSASSILHIEERGVVAAVPAAFGLFPSTGSELRPRRRRCGLSACDSQNPQLRSSP